MAEESNKVTVDDYYIPQKVEAFCRSYCPCETESEASEVFTDDKLRRYFQAYPLPGVGDILIPYLNALEVEGHLLQTSITGEPVLFVSEKLGSHQSLLPGLTDDSPSSD